MGISVDFSQATSFEAIPAGPYVASVTNVELKTGKDSGKQYLNWEFTVQEGEYQGRKLWGITSLDPKATWKLKELLEALTHQEISTEELNVEPSDYLGTEVVIIATQETYEEKLRNRVDGYKPYTPEKRRRG